VEYLNVDILSMNIYVHGGAWWFYQVFVDIFKGRIESIFQSALQSELVSVINQLSNYYLKKIPIKYQITPNLVLDYSLVSKPDVHSTWSTTDHLGNWIWTPKPSNCMFQPPNLPESLFPNKLFTFIVSETMGDCIGSILFEQDFLGGTITQSMVPSNSPIQLNTSDPNMRRILPNLYALYPNTAMDIYVYAIQTPNLTISAASKNLETSLVGLVRIQVQKNHTSEYLPVIFLKLSLNVFTEISVSGNNIVGKISEIAHNTTLVTSTIGPIDMRGVDDLVTLFIALGIEPIINNFLTKGFPIPDVGGVELVKAQIDYGNGYLRVGSDFVYTKQQLDDLLQFLNDQK